MKDVGKNEHGLAKPTTNASLGGPVALSLGSLWHRKMWVGQSCLLMGGGGVGVVLGHASMLTGKICDLRIVSLLEKMCWDVLWIAESGSGGEEEQGWCCAEWRKVTCVGGTKVRLEEIVASWPHALGLLLRGTRVRKGEKIEDIEANKRYFQTWGFKNSQYWKQLSHSFVDWMVWPQQRLWDWRGKMPLRSERRALKLVGTT